MTDPDELIGADYADALEDDRDNPLRAPGLRMPVRDIAGRTQSTQGTRWSEGQYAARGMARMNLRLPVETMELLDEAAEEYGQSRCELIDEAVRAWLAK